MLRIGQTKHITDPLTGKKTVESTPLVERARAEGIPEDMLLKMSSVLSTLRGSNGDGKIPKSLLQSALPDGYSEMSRPKPWGTSSEAGKSLPRNRQLLETLKIDIVNDISGQRQPISSLNYVWVTTQFMILFHHVEEELKRRRNPSWILAYERDVEMMVEKRVSLTAIVLKGEDEECMEVFAQAFEELRVGWMGHIYWEDLDSDDKVTSSFEDDPEEGPACSVM